MKRFVWLGVMLLAGCHASQLTPHVPAEAIPGHYDLRTPPSELKQSVQQLASPSAVRVR